MEKTLFVGQVFVELSKYVFYTKLKKWDLYSSDDPGLTMGVKEPGRARGKEERLVLVSMGYQLQITGLTGSGLSQWKIEPEQFRAY